MTLKSIIQKATKELIDIGTLTATLDVKIILEHILKKDDVYLIANNQEIISNAQYQKFRRLIRRRKKGEPTAYIVGHKEFYGLDFAVNKNVLIPRPETEILVEKGIEFIKLKVDKVHKVISPEIRQRNFHQFNNETIKKMSILDIGTGSGCIIISLIKSLPNPIIHNSSFILRSYACDISEKALKVAKNNAKKQEIYDNIRFLKSDLFGNKNLPKEFDLIIANLPYLTKKRPEAYYTSPEHKGLKFEPEIALYSPNNGFALIEKLVKELPERLTKNGIALLEIDESQTSKLYRLCNRLGFKSHIINNPSEYKGFIEIRR